MEIESTSSVVEGADWKIRPSIDEVLAAGVPHPLAGAISGGGEFLSSDGNGVMHFYEAPFSAVAGVLSNIAGRTVQDATGLTGRHDVALKRPSMDSPSDTQLSVSAAVGELGSS
jgi:uncharacterized protein (TIGR03435 family)